jgi:hydrogenase maturation protease
MKRILIAGIGNIFFGDDAFGCEVAAELGKRQLPAEATVIDFGIRGYDLAYAIMDGYDATILVDAAPRGEKAGTVYLLELDPQKIDSGESELADAHDLTPARVLQLLRSLGGQPRNIYLLGCEPGNVDMDDGAMGLSEAVRAAIPAATVMIENLLIELLRTGPSTDKNFFQTNAATKSETIGQ